MLPEAISLCLGYRGNLLLLSFKVLKSASQETKPGERVKQMVIHLDNGLMKRRGFMEVLYTELEKIEVTCLLESSCVPNSVTWHRNIDATVSNIPSTIAGKIL